MSVRNQLSTANILGGGLTCASFLSAGIILCSIPGHKRSPIDALPVVGSIIPWLVVLYPVRKFDDGKRFESLWRPAVRCSVLAIVLASIIAATLTYKVESLRWLRGPAFFTGGAFGVVVLFAWSCQYLMWRALKGWRTSVSK